MKQQQLFSALISSFLVLAACAPQNNTPSQKQDGNATVSREHCLDNGNTPSCFVEVETSGKSSFYAAASDYDSLVTNSLLTDLNIPMKKIDDAEYVSLANKLSAPTIVYNEKSPEQLDVYANTSEADSYAAVNSKGRRVAGGIGGGFTGALGGAATGATVGSAIPGLGTVIGAIGGSIMGAIGGGFTGAATFWNGKTNLVYHFGDSSTSTEVKLEKKK